MTKTKNITIKLLQFGVIISFFLSVFFYTEHFPFNFVKAQDNKYSQLIFDNRYLLSIPIKKIKVDDIEMAYKRIGTGYPLVMVNGFGSVMDMWNTKFLQTLASNHTIFIFDNRGIGNTSSGQKEFTIKQFAQDTFGLINALKLDKADILGFSMGGMIAQELTLTHPDKVRKLIIYASLCGTEQFNFGQKTKQVMSVMNNLSIPAIEKINMMIPYMFPQNWIINNSNYLGGYTQYLKNLNYLISDKSLNLQSTAIFSWKSLCGQINKIKSPTLVIVGTEDDLTIPYNSIFIAEKIPESFLVQIKGGGHGMMHQYPEEMSSIVSKFLFGENI